MSHFTCTAAHSCPRYAVLLSVPDNKCHYITLQKLRSKIRKTGKKQVPQLSILNIGLAHAHVKLAINSFPYLTPFSLDTLLTFPQ